MPDGIELPISSASAPRYRYYTVNIVTNKVIGEIPFEDVNYERSVKAPGAFDGKITVTDQTNNLDLYNATLPGKTALYVVRNDEAVWGGIIWGRTYDLVGRSLTISASEFTSYLSHRIVWKTYSHSFTAKLSKPSDDSYTRVTLINKTLKSALPLTDSSGNPTVVTINFTDNNLRKYNGDYQVRGLASSPSAPSDPGRSAFYVNLPLLPPKSGVYDGVGVTMKSDTYDYLRDIITSTFSDFTEIEFPNEVIEPGIKEAFSVTTKQLAYSNNVYGVATLTTSEEHGLTLGQHIEVSNVDPMLDGKYSVSETPNKFAFKYIIDNPVSAYDGTTKIFLANTISNVTTVRDTRDEISYRQVTTAVPQYITTISRTNGVVTLTFDGAHNFEKGQKIILTIAETPETIWNVSTTTTKNGKKTTKKVKTNTFNYKKWNYTVQVTSAEEETITYDDPKWKSSTYNKTFLTRVLEDNSAKTAEPVAALMLYPKKSSGYNIGDNVYVDGVDQPQWPYELYDGYQKIYDVSAGPIINVTSYKAANENPNDDELGDISIVTYTCSADPNINTGDEFEVQGITAYPQFNGKFQAFIGSIGLPETNPYYWEVKVKRPVEALSTVAQATGATLQKNGASWIAYRPNTSELRYSLKSEPDNSATISKLAYNKTTKIVTLTTAAAHNFRIGDRVKVSFGKNTGARKDDQKAFGGWVTITGVSDLDSVSYKLIKKEHKLPAPTTSVAEVTKTGTITASKSSTSPAASIDIPIQGIRAEPTSDTYSTVTVYATDNDLKVGDYVSTSFTDPVDYTTDNYSGFSSMENPVKVTEAATNYFRYTVGGPTFTSDSANIYGLTYISDSNVRITIDKSTAYTNVTANVASVNFSQVANNQFVVTTTTNHGLLKGRKVTLSGFPTPGSSYRVAANTVFAANIASISYNQKDATATIVFDASHGLDVTDLSSMSDDVGSRLRIGNAATSVTANTTGTSTIQVSLADWFNTALASTTYSIAQVSTNSSGITNFYTGVHSLAVGDVVTTSGFADPSYNLTGTVIGVLSDAKTGTTLVSGFSIDTGLATLAVTSVSASVSRKESKLIKYTTSIISASSTTTYIEYAVTGHSLAPGDAVKVTGFSSTAYNVLDGVVSAVGQDYFRVAKTMTAGSASGTMGSVTGLIGGHYIKDIPTDTSIIIDVQPAFTSDWTIANTALTSITGNISLVKQAKYIYGATDYSKLNFTADVSAVPALNQLVFKFPDADDAGYSGIYTPTAGTVKMYAPAYRNMINNQPIVGDLFQLSGFRINNNIDYTYLNLDGYTVVSTGAVAGDANKMYVYLQNPKVGKTRPKYSNVVYSSVYPQFNRALPAAGNANLSQAPRESSESRNLYTINKVTRDIANNKATVYTTDTHNIAVGDLVSVDVFKNNFDLFSQNSQTLIANAVTSNSVTYTLTSSVEVDSIAYSNKNVYLYFKGGATAHSWAVGDTVSVPSIVEGGIQYGNSTFTITATTPTAISYYLAGGVNMKKNGLAGNVTKTLTRVSSITIADNIAYGVLSKVPTIYKRPVVYSKTYGEYPNNANIGGITFSTMSYSNKSMPNSPIFGSDLQTVAEILDKYSNGLNGFDYRIDPGLSYEANGVKKFTRKFVLIPTYPKTLTDYLETLPGKKLARGQVATPAALGADKVIFEYPGNITNVSMAEKAESSATRIFVRSGDGKSGSGSEVAYSGAADVDLLQDNWPLLDKKESVTWPLKGAENSAATSSPTNTDDWGNHDDETDYHKSALRFLKESKPPAGDFNIDVNGSITPVIGSYNPGDWCSIIINDNFVKTRLNSVLEPRKDVIVRKIDSIKVAVPNNPAFPEKITLSLIPDWQVDAVGK